MLVYRDSLRRCEVRHWEHGELSIVRKRPRQGGSPGVQCLGLGLLAIEFGGQDAAGTS